MKHATKTLVRIATFALVGGCATNAQLPNEHASDAPESGERVHQPAGPDAKLGTAELEPPDPTANVVKGEPPGYPAVMASWSDPLGTPRTWRESAIGLDAGITDACGIDHRYAFFAFDSATLSELAKRNLRDVANCFTLGALSGHSLVLIGHTDLRGTDQYNDELGKSRARAVADYLEANGLAADRITVRSAGEKHAHENPISWPADRRVDVRIAE